jgi:hypothetical protein
MPGGAIMRGNADRLAATKRNIQDEKVIRFDEALKRVDCSAVTLRRDLNALQALTSYSHRGQFVTLPGIPRFDELGIWFHKRIGFSKYGTSLDTIVALVEDSKEGFSREELEAILKIGISKQIQILVQREKLHRIKLGSRYLYVPGEAMASKTRRLKIVGTRQTEERFDRDVHKSDLIALLKAVLIEKRVGIDVKSIKNLVRRYALQISWNKIQLLLQRHDLLEKKTPSR